jgi:methylated-DNA-protein-cysteine methyltransferase-like protein
MSGFYDAVYKIVEQIPYGHVATFGQIARMAGRPKMARFVGYASNNKKSWHLPWHRVVFKDGTLCSKQFFDKAYKSLKAEGVKFTHDKRVKLPDFQWMPESETMPDDMRDWPLKF